MVNNPKKHHYNAASYLAAFTGGGTQGDDLYVFDQGLIKSWKTSPKQAGSQNHLYDVDLGPNIEPTVVETEILAPLDGEFRRVIKSCVDKQSVPKGDDFDWLLSFVALQSVRVPRIRTLLDEVSTRFVGSRLKSDFKEDQLGAEFEKGLPDVIDAESRAAFRSAVLRGEIEFPFSQTAYVQQLLTITDDMLPYLYQRNWTLGIAEDGVADFVSSDAPVSAVPRNRLTNLPMMHLGHPNNDLMVPLSRRVLLFGTCLPVPKKFVANEITVARINSNTITEARQVFSGTQDFVYLGSDQKVKHWPDLVDSLKRRKGKYSGLKELVGAWFEEIKS